MTKLSQFERLLLRNQYEILAEVAKNPDDRTFFKKACEIVQDGITGEYWQLLQGIGEEITRDVCKKVSDILEMYKYLIHSAEKHNLPPVRFMGFDSNNEAEYGIYIDFLAKEGNWAVVLGNGNADFNSHIPMVERYDVMLVAWRQTASRENLTPEDVGNILSAGRPEVAPE